MNGKKILLIEDDKYILKAYKLGLQNAGYSVSVAEDGCQGLKKAKNEKPHLILLDLIMPEKNGFEVLDEIKKEESIKNTPVIIISNLGQESDIKESKRLGAVDYIIKANSLMDDVLKKVKRHLL